MAMRVVWLKGLIVVLAVAALLLSAPLGDAQSEVTPTLSMKWVGRVVSVTEDLSLRGSVLRVSVVGLKGLPVKISIGDWSVTGLTGSKPEFGEFMVEFAPVPRGNVLIEPQGLATSLTVLSDMTSYITVEFARGEGVTSTPTSSATVIASPWPTQPTFTPIPLPTSTPTFTPLPPTATSSPTATPLPTSTAAPVASATAMASPTQSAPQNVAEMVGPSTITLWSGRIAYTASGPFYGYGAIVARVMGMVGMPVEIRSDGFQAAALTGTKPEYGSFACEFGGLGPGTYTVSPQGLDTSVTIQLGRGGFALVDFSAVVLPVTPYPVTPAQVALLAPTPSVSGMGTPIIVLYPPAATVTPVPYYVPAPLPTMALSSVVTGTSPFYLFLPPMPAWTGRVTQRVAGTISGRLAATVVVRVLGARDLPVVVDSGGWHASALTSSKPEYGDFACEFGGLPAGEYDIIPDGLDLRYRLKVEQGDFVVVDFAYRVPPVLVSPISTVVVPTVPAGPKESWSGRVVSRTVDMDSDSGTIVVQVLGRNGLPVEVKSADGWSAFALTDSKEGYEGFVCEFGRLAPGTYEVVPQGLGAWVELLVGKGSKTLAEFASR